METIGIAAQLVAGDRTLHMISGAISEDQSQKRSRATDQITKEINFEICMCHSRALNAFYWKRAEARGKEGGDGRESWLF
jgi:hypothetical protein